MGPLRLAQRARGCGVLAGLPATGRGAAGGLASPTGPASDTGVRVGAFHRSRPAVLATRGADHVPRLGGRMPRAPAGRTRHARRPARARCLLAHEVTRSDRAQGGVAILVCCVRGGSQRAPRSRVFGGTPPAFSRARCRGARPGRRARGQRHAGQSSEYGGRASESAPATCGCRHHPPCQRIRANDGVQGGDPPAIAITASLG
jgi:hypothetical protein